MNGRLDADLREARDRGPFEGAPSHATVHVSRDLRFAVWGAQRIGQHDLWAIVETPAGRGGSWVAAGLHQSLGLQLGGVAAAVGERQLTLRRNGPRLRIRDRVVRADGPLAGWTFRSRGAAGATWRRADGSVVWERVEQRVTVDAAASPDEIAFVLLAAFANIETGVSALSFLQNL